MKLTHVDKIYFPKEGYTKGDILNYYTKMARFILPYLKDRPIVLHRYPDGIEGNDFYQKNMTNTPPGIRTFPLKQEGKINNYLLIDDLEGLLYAVNLGSIDLHPFLSRLDHLDTPDYCVIDLDPHGISFKAVVEVALVFHEILTEMKIKHFCKTSGGKGLHLLIPLKGKYTLEQSRQFAESLGNRVHEKLPKITSLERSPKKRRNKVYIDCLQNRFGQTIVAPYSVRPREGAYVSTPLEWSEVNAKLKIENFTIKTVLKRLKKKDPMRALLKKL